MSPSRSPASKARGHVLDPRTQAAVLALRRAHELATPSTSRLSSRPRRRQPARASRRSSSTRRRTAAAARCRPRSMVALGRVALQLHLRGAGRPSASPSSTTAPPFFEGSIPRKLGAIGVIARGAVVNFRAKFTHSTLDGGGTPHALCKPNVRRGPDPQASANRGLSRSAVGSKQNILRRNAMNQLENIRVAVLATDGVEEAEIVEPLRGAPRRGDCSRSADAQRQRHPDDAPRRKTGSQPACRASPMPVPATTRP